MGLLAYLIVQLKEKQMIAMVMVVIGVFNQVILLENVLMRI